MEAFKRRRYDRVPSGAGKRTKNHRRTKKPLSGERGFDIPQRIGHFNSSKLSMTWLTMPYSRASSASIQ